MKIAEISPRKPLTPDQARIKVLQDQAKRARAAVKAEKARQRIKKNQNIISQLTVKK